MQQTWLRQQILQIVSVSFKDILVLERRIPLLVLSKKYVRSVLAVVL